MNSEKLVNFLLVEFSKRLSKEKLHKYVNKSTDHGLRCIHYASYRGNIEIIGNLIIFGADIDVITNKGLNILHVAAQGDQPNSLIYFIERFGLQIDTKDNFGSTPLHWACYTGSVNAFNFIVNKYRDSVDLNSQDNEGLTPLHLAVMSGKLMYKIILKIR